MMKQPTDDSRDSGEIAAAVLLTIVGFAGGVALGFLLIAYVPPAINAIQPPPNTEFAIAKGRAAYYVVLSIGIFVGFLAILRRKQSYLIRGLLIGISVGLLGLFALCDLFSIPTLLQ